MNFDPEDFKPIKKGWSRYQKRSSKKIEYGLFKGQEVILKWYKKPEENFQLWQEVFALRILKDNPNTPNLILCDEEKSLVVMSYCGNSFFRDFTERDRQIPCDLLKKAIDIYKQIGEELGIWHGDMHTDNITVIGSKVYLIDWGIFRTKPTEHAWRGVMHLWRIKCWDDSSVAEQQAHLEYVTSLPERKGESRGAHLDHADWCGMQSSHPDAVEEAPVAIPSAHLGFGSGLSYTEVPPDLVKPRGPDKYYPGHPKRPG
jgi:predicted Ser/Thr protein kinase